MIIDDSNNINTIEKSGLSEDYTNYFINTFKPNNQVIYGELLLVGEEGIRFQINTLPCLIGRKEISKTHNSILKSSIDVLRLMKINIRNRVEILSCKCM